MASDNHGPTKKWSIEARILLIGLIVVGVLGLGVAEKIWDDFRPGPSTEEVLGRHRAEFAGMRTRLKGIARSLPPVGSVKADSLPKNLEPKLEYFPHKEFPNFNTAVLMAEHCLDPDRRLQVGKEFDLLLGEDGLLFHLVWTGDKSPLTAEALQKPAGRLGAELKQSLGYRYLVVARPVRFDPPRVTGETTFVGSEVDLEVFLVDLHDGTLSGQFRRAERCKASALEEFRAEKIEGVTAEECLAAMTALQAKIEIARTLRATGGRFTLDP